MDHLLRQTNPATRNVAAVDCLFGFTGRPLDKGTGLQNNLNRWYDSSVGRWISQDPTGFTAGDTNEYRYVGNSPANATDPSGLDIIVLFGPKIKAGKLVTVGHPAIMIGTDQSGWLYISFHAGDQFTTNDNVVVEPYATVAAAQAAINVTGEYTQYLYIPTSAQQDVLALETARQWVNNGPQTALGKALKRMFGDKFNPPLGVSKVYRLTTQNCATFVSDVIRAAAPQINFPAYNGIKEAGKWLPLNWWPDEVLPWAANYPLGKNSIGPFAWNAANAASLPTIPAQLEVFSPVPNAKIYVSLAQQQQQATSYTARQGGNLVLTPPLRVGAMYYTVKVTLVLPDGRWMTQSATVRAGLKTVVPVIFPNP